MLCVIKCLEKEGGRHDDDVAPLFIAYTSERSKVLQKYEQHLISNANKFQLLSDIEIKYFDPLEKKRCSKVEADSVIKEILEDASTQLVPSNKKNVQSKAENRLNAGEIHMQKTVTPVLTLKAKVLPKENANAILLAQEAAREKLGRLFMDKTKVQKANETKNILAPLTEWKEAEYIGSSSVDSYRSSSTIYPNTLPLSVDDSQIYNENGRSDRNEYVSSDSQHVIDSEVRVNFDDGKRQRVESWLKDTPNDMTKIDDIEVDCPYAHNDLPNTRESVVASEGRRTSVMTGYQESLDIKKAWISRKL
ncbi:MAG: hypothetical protein QS748_12315 [Candidatus Endonucleobacter bathymodioli]|uniref:Uncharacterized protein n=1 Tax=Candidatus Endonucleibacter bathymodioli TaxID=539814 RepID=A0AA90NMK0_9GAMM|nr:hypothetical protein [Candidatus Endonucleobacter bathymodioli]